MTNTNDVLIRRESGIGRITLNRPKALHALTTDMCSAMLSAVEKWHNDRTIHVVIVDHAQDTRGFCAGGDISMLARSGAADGREAMAFFETEYRLNAAIKRFAKPFIALMDGIAMGGGVGISVHGSHRIATGNTVFAMPETGIGLFPDVGGGWFLPRLRGETGTWLALTGARLKGSDVAAARVATHFVPNELLPNVRRELLSADFSVDAAQLVNTILAGRSQVPPTAPFQDRSALIDRVFSGSTIEDIMQSLAEENCDWSQAQLKILNSKSPRTLKVTLRQLREGRAFETFEDNMQNEYRIAARQVRSADFQEGVRAVIKDKDNAPVWPSGSLAEVSEADVDAVFAPLPHGEELTFSPED